MNLRTDTWKSFYLKDLYVVKMGNGFDKNKMTDEMPSVNFVSRISYNNGVDCKVDILEGVEPYPAGVMTVALGGSYLGSCFVQQEPFYTAQNVAVLTPKDKHMNRFINTFVSALVRYESKIKYYAFGRELNTHIGRDFSISLPVQYNEDGTVCIDKKTTYSEEGYVPDWKFMEDYIKSLHYKPLTTKKSAKLLSLNIKEWKSFKVGSVFTIKNGKGITQEEIDDNTGAFPAVQSGEENNGVLGKIDLEYCKKMNYTYSTRSCLTVARSGSAGFVAFQKDGCVVGDSAKILLLDEKVATVECYLFLQTILSVNRIKYAYGRKVTEGKYMNDYIKLPVVHNSDGTIYIDMKSPYSEKGYVPDWKFMENYIRALPYGDRL